ncbi:MAG: helix-turn-helix domain-containing protein, partial [Halobacteriales archaeon]|nr:helix-turn-helix domain-containing protein [Halobacteriales archaeon]
MGRGRWTRRSACTKRSVQSVTGSPRFALSKITGRYTSTGRRLITLVSVRLHQVTMPVDFESYHPSNLPTEGTNGRRILEHLAQHPELGFTPSELADELEIPRGSVGTTLSRLEERGLVRHKG